MLLQVQVWCGWREDKRGSARSEEPPQSQPAAGTVQDATLTHLALETFGHSPLLRKRKDCHVLHFNDTSHLIVTLSKLNAGEAGHTGLD